jgi:pyrroline-5-carboxylate reductase
MQNRVVIFGVGHMGTAILLGLQRRGYRHIVAVDPSAARRQVVQHAGADAVERLTQLTSSDVVVLAMPPQAFSQFCAERDLFAGHTGPVISVMAGVRLAAMARGLGVSQLIRVIPNTPAEVYQGMTVAVPGPGMTADNLSEAKRVLDSIGTTLIVADEALIDPATALCGGGPAFVAYFVDALQQFAVRTGFAAADAQVITRQVLRGTVALLEATGKPAMQICREVMTPGGTTERGIAHFDAEGVKTIVQEALKRASERSRALGADNTSSPPVQTCH